MECIVQRKQLKLQREDIGSSLRIKEIRKSKVEQQQLLWERLGKSSHRREEFDKVCYELFSER